MSKARKRKSRKQTAREQSPGPPSLDVQALQRLKETCERLLGQVPERSGTDGAPADCKMIHATDIAALLGISTRHARRMMHEWVAKYAVKAVHVNPRDSRSALSITEHDFAVVCRHEPHLADRRRRRPRGRRASPKVVYLSPDQAIECPRCRGRKVKRNGRYLNRRYVKCLSCSRRGKRRGDFVVVLQADSAGMSEQSHALGHVPQIASTTKRRT